MAKAQEDLNAEGHVREVWACNLEKEMEAIRDLVEKYCYISMDTEFPGIVAKPVGTFSSPLKYRYQALRCNVDLLKVIQIGISFANEDGELPPGISTWQFNFRFDLEKDLYAKKSIELLSASGIDFHKHEEHGIDVNHFAELLTSSGCVLFNNVKWISFQSSYDFAYLLKILTCKQLPQTEYEFFKLLNTYFPCIYDVKYLISTCKNLKGGLQEVSDMLQLKRIGSQHQAGSDSLLTGNVFFKLKETFFDGQIDQSKYLCVLHGLSPANDETSKLTK